MQPMTIVVETEKTETKLSKAGKPYVTQTVTFQGNKFTRFINDDSLALGLGDTTSIGVETTTSVGKGGKVFTNNNFTVLEVLQKGSGTPSTIPQSQPNLNVQLGNTVTQSLSSAPVISSIPLGQSSQKIDKDELEKKKSLSMEVSGILQAIIHHHGLDANTEELLRQALRLKRGVAAELEQTGTV